MNSMSGKELAKLLERNVLKSAFSEDFKEITEEPTEQQRNCDDVDS
ncbi:hypothetical protein RIVM261_050230 [Rivularia sp. IAM M-261]|nr:hypothetical protein CAL7716_003480 [Calothrix sp. PCC 7716]GJD20067.1 hypothetical protein RIVM261_050230 [Rivularia sp. IAM M-261]